MINLKEKVTSTIEAFRTNEQEYIEALEAALEPYKSPAMQQRYTQEGLHQSILEEMAAVREDWTRSDKVLNQLLNTQLQEAKKALIDPAPQKSADYSLQISNALRFLELEGNELTDEVAYSILKDFTEDLHQMQLFERVVIRQLSAGHNPITPLDMLQQFPMTFGKLHESQFILNTFNEMEALAENLFLHEKSEGQIIVIGLNRYATPRSGYRDRADADSLIKLAEVIDKELVLRGHKLERV